MAFFRNSLPLSDPVADGSKLAWHVPVVSELTPIQAIEEGLISPAEASSALIGAGEQRMKDSRPNDPLAGLTPKQIFTDCIWLSDESPTTKLVLLCVSRFFKAETLTSSMSYSQIEAECSLSDRSCKRVVADVTCKPQKTLDADDFNQALRDARDRW